MAATTATLGIEKAASWLSSPLQDQLLVICWAPSAAALVSAVVSWLSPLSSACTNRMWQVGQIADTMSRSRASSVSQLRLPLEVGFLG